MTATNVRKVDFLSLAPYVRYVQEFEEEKEMKVPPRIIYDYEIIFMVGGSGTYRMNERTIELKAGEALFIRPFVQNSFRIEANQYCHYFAVHFDLVYMGEKLDFAAEEVYVNVDYQNIDFVPPDEELTRRPLAELQEVSFPETMTCSEPHRLAALFRELLAAFGAKSFGYHLEMRILLLKILQQLIRDLSTTEGIGKGHKYRGQMIRAVEHMQTYYAEELDVNKLASSLHFAPNYFRNLFKEATGRTPIEYLTMIRMEKAKELLTQRGVSVSQVSERVGYKDIHYFSRLFKKIEGLSPKNYVESLIGNHRSN